jgi:hypothetical protein
MRMSVIKKWWWVRHVANAGAQNYWRRLIQALSIDWL